MILNAVKHDNSLNDGCVNISRQLCKFEFILSLDPKLQYIINQELYFEIIEISNIKIHEKSTLIFVRSRPERAS